MCIGKGVIVDRQVGHSIEKSRQVCWSQEDQSNGRNPGQGQATALEGPKHQASYPDGGPREAPLPRLGWEGGKVDL